MVLNRKRGPGSRHDVMDRNRETAAEDCRAKKYLYRAMYRYRNMRMRQESEGHGVTDPLGLSSGCFCSLCCEQGIRKGGPGRWRDCGSFQMVWLNF